MPGYEKETMERKTSQGGKRAEKRTKRNGTSKANGEVRMCGRGKKEKKEVELTFLQGSWEWRPAW